MLNEETEILCRTALAEKAGQAENISVNIAGPVYFLDKADFAAQTGITKADKTKTENSEALKNLLCNFVMTSFNRLDDTQKGTARCPVMLVTYEILVFQEFRPGLEAETGASNRHIAAVLQVWQRFLSGHILRDSPLIRHGALEQKGVTIKNQATDFLPGVKGFFTNLQTKVEVS